MKNQFLHKFLALLLIALGAATGALAQNVAKIGTTEYASLQEAFDAAAAYSSATSAKKTYIYILADASFDKIEYEGKYVTVNLQKHIVKGNNIIVKGKDAVLNIIDSRAKAPTVSTDDNYMVSYSTGGTLELTGSITATDGAIVKVGSGKVVSTTTMALCAQGDVTGANSIESTIEITGGYIKAQEFCVSPQGRGATAIISGGVLESLDNAVVAGNGTNTQTEKRGGTTITISGKCTLIGRIQSKGYAACGIYHPQEGNLLVKYASGGEPKIIAVNGAGIVMRGGTLDFKAGSVIATGDKNFSGKVGDSPVVVGTSGIVFDRDCNYYDVANTKIGITGTGKINISGPNSAIQVINNDAKDISGVFDITTGNYSSDISSCLGSTVECNKHGDTYLVGDFKAQIGDVKYLNLRDAFKEAVTGDVVKILKDEVGLSYEPSVTNKDIVLDLNGKSIKYRDILVGASGKLTIKDSSEGQTGVLDANTSNYAACIKAGGKLVLESGKITNTYNNNNVGNVAVRVYGDDKTGIQSTFDIKGGVVETKGTPVFVCYKGATVNMTGGELKASGLACIAGNGTDTGGTTINISGGMLTATAADEASAACGIYHPQEGTLNITGGTINVADGVGVLVRGGKMNMTGGEVNATGDVSKTGTVGDSRQVVPTSGVVLDRDSNYPAVTTAEVKIDKDAKVSGAKAAVELLNANNVADAKKAVQLKGGTYSSDVSALLDENSVAAKNEDNTYSITTYYAKVGDQKYVTLKEAFTAATDGQTVEVINDIENFETLTINKSVKLFMYDKAKGKGYMINGQSITVGENGSLSIGNINRATNVTVSNDGNYTVSYDNNCGTLSLTGRISVVNGGVVTLNGGMVESTKSYAILADGNRTTSADEVTSTINIYGGYIKAQEACASVRGKGANLNIKGTPVMESLDNAVIMGSGNAIDNGTKIYINGACTLIGRIKSPGYVACGIYHPQDGELTIRYGSKTPEKSARIIAINGAGIVMRGGKLNFTGGYVIATGDKDLTGKVGDSRVVVGTSGIVYDSECGYPSVKTVSINVAPGSDPYAVIKGSKSAIDVVKAADDVDADKAITIHHGTFSSDVSAYCVDGFTATPNADGTYGITEVGDAMLVYADSYTNVETGGKVEIDADKLNKMLITKDVPGVDISLKVNFANTNWHSFVAPFDFVLTAEMLQNFGFAKLYNCDLDNGNTVFSFRELAAGTKIEAYQAYLIKTTTTGYSTLNVGKADVVTAKAPSDCSSTDEYYVFHGVMENTTIADKYGYYLRSETQSLVYNNNVEAWIPPFSFYLTMQNRKTNEFIVPTQAAAAPRFQVIGEGEATGITDVTTDVNSVAAKVYNLQGVEVGTSTAGLPKGVYIQNGRKIMVK